MTVMCSDRRPLPGRQTTASSPGYENDTIYSDVRVGIPTGTESGEGVPAPFPGRRGRGELAETWVDTVVLVFGCGLYLKGATFDWMVFLKACLPGVWELGRWYPGRG